MSGKNPVFGASLFRSCFLFNRDWHAIACPTKSNVFLLDYKKLPSSVIAILHQQNSQGWKEKRRQEQMELTMGMLRDLLMTAKDPLDVSAGNFGDLRHVEVVPHKNPTMPRSLHWTCVRILRVFLLTGYLSHWQDLYWIWNSLRKLTLLNCPLLHWRRPLSTSIHGDLPTISQEPEARRAAERMPKSFSTFMEALSKKWITRRPEPVLGAPPELKKDSHWKGILFSPPMFFRFFVASQCKSKYFIQKWCFWKLE